MKTQSLAFVMIVGLSVMGCSEALQLESGRWSQSGPPPARPSGVDVKSAPLAFGNHKMIFQSQKIDGVEIEGSYYKEIRSENLEFVAYKWSSHIPFKLRTQVLRMKAQSRSIQKKFNRKYPEYELRDLIEKPKLIVRNGEVNWQFTFQTKMGTVEGIFLDRELKIKEKKLLGSHLNTPTAHLFPEGPLKSQLQRVLLAELTGSRTLQSDRLKVVTQSPLLAEADQFAFQYPVEDQRFEQVQVFFYLSKVLQWCEKQFKFQLPFILEAETSVGYPEKTNAAFYYSHKIRLGDGDDDVFSRIPLDPSIVIHESFHAVIESMARLPYEGEGGSLNEGFADILTSLLLNNPRMGEASYKKASYKRTVENELKFSDQNGGLYHDSGMISGLFWSIQKAIGRDAGIALIWDVLSRLGPDSKFADFKQSLNEAVLKLPEKEQSKAIEMIQQRGWGE